MLPCAATSLVAMSGGVADGFRSLVSSWAGSRGQAAPAAVGNAVERATAAVKDTVSAYSVSEEQFFDEDRFSEAEIRSALNNPGLDMKLVAMKRILAGMACGMDVEALFADVVKNVSTTNLELKKMTFRKKATLYILKSLKKKIRRLRLF